MRILLVRLRLIGDVVFTTPIIRALRRRYPEAHLAYVVEEEAAPIVWHHPPLDECIVTPRRRGLARVQEDTSLGRRLRAGRFDIAIDLHGGPRAAWLTRASGAPMRIGYRMPGRAWMYTHAVPRPADLAPRHCVLNQWDLLAPLDIAPGTPGDTAVEVTGAPGADADVRARLARLGIEDEDPLILVHVSAGNPFRRWPAAAFEALVVTLVRRDPRRRVLLFSGPSDIPAATRIAQGARHSLGPALAPAIQVANPPLDEFAALMQRASVYIGGDSGPLHIAASTSVPIVGLLGPTLAARSAPWRDPRLFAEMVDAGPLPCRPCAQRECEPGDFRCLTGLAPDRVADAAERALARSTIIGEVHA